MGLSETISILPISRSILSTPNANQTSFLLIEDQGEVMDRPWTVISERPYESTTPSFYSILDLKMTFVYIFKFNAYL